MTVAWSSLIMPKAKARYLTIVGQAAIYLLLTWIITNENQAAQSGGSEGEAIAPC